MKINFISDSINNHFNWFPQSNNLKVLYCYFFKSKVEFNKTFFSDIQNAFLDKIADKIYNCYLFVAIDYGNNKIADYYKVWKRIEKTNSIVGLQVIKEQLFDSSYVGLASFSPEELNVALAIQNNHKNKSFILIQTKNEQSINITDTASLFLKNDTNLGFTQLILKYCTEGTFICRIGDGGEEWEVAFAYS